MPLSGPDNWGRFYPPRKKRWNLMSSEFSNTNMPPIHSGPEREYQGFNRWDELWNQEKKRQYAEKGTWKDSPFFNYGKIPDSATMASKKKGPTAEERAEAWKQAMADAQGFMGPMQGDTIPGGAVGHRVEGGGIYETAGGNPQTAGLLSAAPEAFWKKKLWT